MNWKKIKNLYRSFYQIMYDDPSSDNLKEHLILCFTDPECLREMANTPKLKVDLPCNLWLDFGKSYKKSGHFKRIKFQKDHGNKMNKNNLAEMTLEGNIIENTNKGTSLSTKDEKSIRNFVLNNQRLLSLLSDSDLYLSDFYDIMIPGGDTASEQEKLEQEKELIEILKRYEKNEILKQA